MSTRKPWRDRYLMFGAPFIGDEEQTFSLPLSLAVSDDDAADVVRALKLVLGA